MFTESLPEMAPCWVWQEAAPLLLQDYDIRPSRRFGGGDGGVEEVLPLRSPGAASDTPPEPLYLLKRCMRDALAERLSYLCARSLNIAYQTVHWVRYPDSLGRARRARRSQRGLAPLQPAVAVDFVSGALPVRGVDLATQTCRVRDGRAERALPVQNAADYYRLLALGVFTDDLESGQMLYHAGWLFGHDLTLGFDLAALRRLSTGLTAQLRAWGQPEPALPEPSLDARLLRCRLEVYTFADPEAQRLFCATLYELAAAPQLPALLAADLSAAPAPAARELAEAVRQWVERRQQVVAQVVTEAV